MHDPCPAGPLKVSVFHPWKATFRWLSHCTLNDLWLFAIAKARSAKSLLTSISRSTFGASITFSPVVGSEWDRKCPLPSGRQDQRPTRGRQRRGRKSPPGRRNRMQSQPLAPEPHHAQVREPAAELLRFARPLSGRPPGAKNVLHRRAPFIASVCAVWMWQMAMARASAASASVPFFRSLREQAGAFLRRPAGAGLRCAERPGTTARRAPRRQSRLFPFRGDRAAGRGFPRCRRPRSWWSARSAEAVRRPRPSFAAD